MHAGDVVAAVVAGVSAEFAIATLTARWAYQHNPDDLTDGEALTAGVFWFLYWPYMGLAKLIRAWLKLIREG